MSCPECTCPAAAPPPPADASTAIIQLTAALVLLVFSGLFSGLNLGLMSFTYDDLGLVIAGSNDPDEVRYATRIRVLRKHGNLLLCTLLIGNTLVNAVIAVLLADLSSGTIGTLITTAGIVVFGEIGPQSICSRHALRVGSAALPIVWLFVIVCFPVAFPISLILDWLLGREVSGVFSRQGLLALIRLNVESAQHAVQSGLTRDDAQLLGGALTFKDHTVGDVMTKLEACFCLPSDTVLNKETILTILQRGHTRIPVYEGHPSNIIALLFCKVPLLPFAALRSSSVHRGRPRFPACVVGAVARQARFLKS